eukprot:436521-Rhodomonas_salina.2
MLLPTRCALSGTETGYAATSKRWRSVGRKRKCGGPRTGVRPPPTEKTWPNQMQLATRPVQFAPGVRLPAFYFAPPCVRFAMPFLDRATHAVLDTDIYRATLCAELT